MVLLDNIQGNPKQFYEYIKGERLTRGRIRTSGIKVINSVWSHRRKVFLLCFDHEEIYEDWGTGAFNGSVLRAVTIMVEEVLKILKLMTVGKL